MNLKTIIFPLLALILITPSVLLYAGAEDEQYQQTFNETAEATGHFTENLGQWDKEFTFIGDTLGGHLALSPGSVYLDLLNYQEEEITGGHVLAYRFLDSSTSIPKGSDELSHDNNYFLGNDPDKWVSGADNYRKVSYTDIWENIDLSYILTPTGPKYEFHLSPGSDLSDIRIRMDGVEEIETSGNELTIRVTDDITIRDTGLVAYYADDMSMIDVDFKVLGDNTYGFGLQDHDEDRSIIIDPYLKFSWIGGSGGDNGKSIRIDENGNIYMTGTTTSNSNFPTTPGAYDTTYGGGFSGDLFVTKFNSSFMSLDYCTYIGGSDTDTPAGMDVRNGEVVFTGVTYGNNYPITTNAYNDTNVGWYTIIVTKLNKTGGSLEFSTFVDGKANEFGSSVRYDDQGNVLVMGSTSSTDFPTTLGAFDRTANSTTGGMSDQDVVIFKLNSAGSNMIFSTYYGGSSGDSATLAGIDDNGDIIICGTTFSSDLQTTSGAYSSSLSGLIDMFLARFNHNCSKLLNSTYFGGSNMDYASNAAILPGGEIVAAGYTWASIPTIAGGYDTTPNGNVDSFLIRFDSNFTTLKASTYIGGGQDERSPVMNIGPEGNVFIYGTTISTDFPTTPGADDTTFNGTTGLNLYLAKLDGNLSTLMYATYLGGDGFEALGGLKPISPFKVLLAGGASATDFKVEGIGFDQIKDVGSDAFLLELSLLAPPTKPRNLTNTRGDDWVHLNWELPLSDGGSPITSYEVYKISRLSEIPDDPLSILPSGTLDYNDTTIKVDDEWYYFVKAVNDISASPRSNMIRIADDILPWLGLDSTPSTATSATTLTFSTEVFDNAFVDSVRIEYYLDLWGDTGYFNFSMTDLGDGTFSHTIPLPDEEFKISYFFTLNDTSDNWFNGPMKEVDVVGSIYPIFGEDNTDTEVKAGDSMKFSIEVWDNVDIEDVTVEFWSERIYRQNVSMDNIAGNIFEYTFKTKRYSLAPIHYIFHAVDPAGHWNSTPETVLGLLDAEVPTIATDNTPLEATTGDPFTFSIQVSDNQEVSMVWVNYTMNGENFNQTLVNDYGNFYDLEIVIPDIVGRMSYQFFGLDENNNLGSVPAKSIIIIDNDKPKAGDDLTNETAYCGDIFRFNVEASDNVAIGVVEVEYWFGDGAHFITSLLEESSYVINIKIPTSEVRDLAYFFKVKDTSGNMVETDVLKVMVKDLVPPSLVSDNIQTIAKAGTEWELNVKVSDNVGINRVICTWQRVGVIPSELYMDRNNGHFTGSINLPDDEIDQITYILTIVDSSGNQIKTDERTVQVVDAIKPTIQQLQDLKVGTRTELNIEIITSDNIGVETLIIENCPIGSTGNWIKGAISEPGTYFIRVVATDTAGNIAEMTFKIEVEGTSSSSGDEEGSDPIVFILPIIALIIMIIAILLFFILKNKEGKQELPPLPSELNGVPPEPTQESELEKMFQSSYNGGN